MTASPQPGNQDERHGRAQLTALCACGHYQDLHDTDDEKDPHGGACIVWRQVEYGRLYCPCPSFHAAAAAGQTGAGGEADDGPIHACPPGSSGTTPCCGRTPFELPRTDRMTIDPALVTCPTASTVNDRCPVRMVINGQPCTCATTYAAHRAMVDGPPAPSAGQDTGQMRDEIARLYPMGDEDPAKNPEAWDFADMLLDGPLRRLIAERDEARAQVQEAAEALREVHQPDGTEPLACDWCGEAWPCSTIRALDGPP